VIVQPTGEHPGIIQVDSAGDAASCPQPIINGQATSNGPSIVACSTTSSVADCLPGTGRTPSRVGVYAASLGRPAGHIATPFPSTYGDTAAVATPRSGRARADARYRQNVTALDTTARLVLTGNGGLPPGCVVVLANSCIGNGLTWVVLRQVDCDALSAFFAVAGRVASPNLWFNCDLHVTVPLTLSAADSNVVVTGNLTVSSRFTITDPRTVYVGGRATGNKVGLDLGGNTSELGINNGAPGQDCSGHEQPGRTTVLVVGDGRFNMASGAQAHLCQTFVYLASGFGKVPAHDGTPPCQTTTCANYLGSVSISSGADVDWSAPNEITGRQPSAQELDFTSRYEDLALWTEAGGGSNGLTGGAATNLSGIYFMPNADAFTLAGNGSLPIRLSAQFICTSLKVTGGAVLYLVPNPEDSLQVLVYTTLLVR
jgi:hypothetical protein